MQKFIAIYHTGDHFQRREFFAEDWSEAFKMWSYTVFSEGFSLKVLALAENFSSEEFDDSATMWVHND